MGERYNLARHDFTIGATNVDPGVQASFVVSI